MLRTAISGYFYFAIYNDTVFRPICPSSLCINSKLQRFSVHVRYSYAQESANDRLFNHLMTRYQKNVKPGSPNDTTVVKFGLTVICAELDTFSGHLKTYAWQSMVGNTNLLQGFSYTQLSRLTTVVSPGPGASGHKTT